jgi:hypothetical protein
MGYGIAFFLSFVALLRELTGSFSGALVIRLYATESSVWTASETGSARLPLYRRYKLLSG